MCTVKSATYTPIPPVLSKKSIIIASTLTSSARIRDRHHLEGSLLCCVPYAHEHATQTHPLAIPQPHTSHNDTEKQASSVPLCVHPTLAWPYPNPEQDPVATIEVPDVSWREALAARRTPHTVDRARSDAGQEHIHSKPGSALMGGREMCVQDVDGKHTPPLVENRSVHEAADQQALDVS